MKTSLDKDEYRENPVFMDLVSLLGNGFVLSLFNIDFLFFEYLLPIVGSAIMLYGCHLIKNYNKNFLVAYYMAFVRFILMMINFLLDWTSFNSNIYVAYIQITVSSILIIIFFIQMDSGFSAMYHDAGIANYPHQFFKYIFLYLCNVLSTYLTMQLGILGALISIIILLLNVLYISLAFHKIGKTLTFSSLEIEISSYSHEMIRKHFFLVGGYILVLAVTIYYSNKSSLLVSQSPHNNIEISKEYEDTKSRLVSLGMKKSIVEDLPTSEYDYLTAAYSISSQADIQKVNGGTIQFTCYRIKSSNSERVVVYYKWLKEPDNRLFQILEFCTVGLQNICELNSGCIYSDPDSNLSMELPSQELSINKAGNPYTNQKLSNIGDSLRGFLAFSYSPVDTAKLPLNDMQINLYYQVSIFNLPYLKIVDYMDYYNNYKTNIVYNKLSVPITDLFK